MTFYCTNFTGFNPVGVAIIADADTREDAAKTMNDVLQISGLPGDVNPEDVLPLKQDSVVLLNDGDY